MLNLSGSYDTVSNRERRASEKEGHCTEQGLRTEAQELLQRIQDPLPAEIGLALRALIPEAYFIPHLFHNRKTK